MTAQKDTPSTDDDIPKSLFAWRPDARAGRTRADKFLAEMLAEMYEQLALWSLEYFELADWLPKVLDSLATSADALELLDALFGYCKGDSAALAGLSPEIAALIEEPPNTSRTIIACKAEFFYAAILGTTCHTHLVDGNVELALKNYAAARGCLGRIDAFIDVLSGDDTMTAIGRRGAIARLLNDPKQEERKQVRECWEIWAKNPSRYSGKAEFARDMLSKFEHLKSQPVIERWCREWEREASGQTTKSAG